MPVIAAIERLGNLGYVAVGKETTAGTAVTPATFVPVYKATLDSDLKYDKDNPIMGVRSNPFNVFMGSREHTGQIEALAEANTVEYWFDMFLSQGSITGSNPYTHPFSEGTSNSYTIDVAKGQMVERYFGCQAEGITPKFEKNKMVLTMDISARRSLLSRQIATVSTTTITLDTTYDPAPNTGFVASDLVTLLNTGNTTTLNTTISSVNADGITLVLGASAAAFNPGDLIYLRPQTASYTTVAPFLWTQSEFRFGSTAAAALTATHTPMETGSLWKLMNKFEKKGGSDRSGSFDPASLVRLQTEAEVTLKVFFDQPTLNMQTWLNTGQSALVCRHFSTNKTYELRVTFDSLRYETHKRDLDSGKIIYADIKGTPIYNTSNAEMFSVTLINALSS